MLQIFKDPIQHLDVKLVSPMSCRSHQLASPNFLLYFYLLIKRESGHRLMVLSS